MSETKKPMFEVQIEPVRTDELEKLAELAARTFSDAFGHTIEKEDLAQDLAENRSVLYFKKKLNSCKTLVAKHEDRIVGYVQYGVVLIPEAEASDEDREIGRLYVETELQGRGIGRKLLDAVLGDLDMVKAPKIYLQVWGENKRAISLYQRYGFKECGITTFKLGSKLAQELIMVRHQNQDGLSQ
jgi:diamine N-acetyltransferase